MRAFVEMQLSLFPLLKNDKNRRKPTSADTRLLENLQSYLPETARDVAVQQVCEQPVSIRIVGSRTSKSGDYRPAQHSHPPRITVNGSLNPFAFLITLVHELAHHHVELDHQAALGKFSLKRKRRPKPHGAEWKEKFRRLMEPYLSPEVFPPDLLSALFRYLEDPKASSAADHRLSKALRQYDPHNNTVRLEELPYDAVFSIHGRRLFRKKEKMRTRFRCICLQTNRIYLVSAHAPVEHLPH